MKKSLRMVFSYILFLPFFCSLTGCDKEDLQNCISDISLPASGSFNTDRAVLDQLYNSLVADAGSDNCVPNAIWKFTPLGAKSCGGPASFLIYNAAAVDENCFLARVSQFTALTAAFNQKHGLGSDCSIVPAPTGIDCVEGRPVLTY
jgi:hypothetical protein